MQKPNAPPAPGIRPIPPHPPRFYVKVDLRCCMACPRKLKRKLERLDGVVAITMHKKEGLVGVSGAIDSQKVITKLAEWGRTAVLWPPQQNVHSKLMPTAPDLTTNSSQKNNDSDPYFDSNSDSDDHDCPFRGRKSITWQRPHAEINKNSSSGTKKCCWLLSLFRRGNDSGGAEKPSASLAGRPKGAVPPAGSAIFPRRPMPEQGVPWSLGVPVRRHCPQYGRTPYYGGQFRGTFMGQYGRPPLPPPAPPPPPPPPFMGPSYYDFGRMYPPPPLPYYYGSSISRPQYDYRPMIHYARYEDNYFWSAFGS